LKPDISISIASGTHCVACEGFKLQLSFMQVQGSGVGYEVGELVGIVVGANVGLDEGADDGVVVGA